MASSCFRQWRGLRRREAARGWVGLPELESAFYRFLSLYGRGALEEWTTFRLAGGAIEAALEK